MDAFSYSSMHHNIRKRRRVAVIEHAARHWIPIFRRWADDLPINSEIL